MDSIKDIVFALPVILFITLIWYSVRLIRHKHKFGNEFRTIIKAARFNEIIRSLLACWIISLICITLVPRGFWSEFWECIIHRQNPFENFWGISYDVSFVPKILYYVSVGDLELLLWAVKLTVPHLLLNVAVFVPLGMALPFIYKKSSIIKVLLAGLLFSFLIEFVQHYVGRQSEIDDLICNTLGAVAGYLLYLLIKRLFPNFTEKGKLSANDLWIGAQNADK